MQTEQEEGKHNAPEAKDVPSEPTHEVVDPEETEVKQLKSIPSCWICYEDSETESLIRPCRCSGSVGEVHESCLLEWLNRSQHNECTLCHTSYQYDNVYKYKWVEYLARPSHLNNFVYATISVLFVLFHVITSYFFGYPFFHFSFYYVKILLLEIDIFATFFALVLYAISFFLSQELHDSFISELNSSDLLSGVEISVALGSACIFSSHLLIITVTTITKYLESYLTKYYIQRKIFNFH